MNKSINKTKHSIQHIFHDVQFTKSSHPSNKKTLTAIYKKSNLKEFLPQFLICLEICLQHEEKSQNVERTLDFVADFAASFSQTLGEDESCPLLEGVFQFIFENHDCHLPLVRLRLCQLMNRLLDNMGHDATVAEEVYNRIAESMLVRLQDTMSSVRTQAVYALHRLQEPASPKCDIIQAFMYHMTHDPCHEVRRAVIQKIAVNKLTLSSILTRMNDIKDVVRKEAYTIINRFLIRQFTIKQRQLILENGLGDRSEMTRDYVIGTLIPNWLKYFNHNYYEFLECIHIEKVPDVGIKLLKAIFGKQHDVILESRVKDMWIVNQSIAYSRLNIITVLYWRALAEYLRPTDDDVQNDNIFRQVMPDLTPFCQYIRLYYFPPPPASTPDQSAQSVSDVAPPGGGAESSPQNNTETSSSQHNSQADQSSSAEQKEKDTTDKSEQGPHKPDETVLVHLLEMCKVYDLADEMGRASLRQLCVEALQSERVTLISVPTLAGLLDHVLPSPSTKLTVMAEIISELREPLQANDSDVYVPDLLLQEAEDKKAELIDKMAELDGELEIVQQLGDEGRVAEIRSAQATYRRELNIMNTVAPHEFGRNVNNDPETLKKCLTIVEEILKKGKITKMNSTLYSLMQNFVTPTLNLKIEGEAGDLIKNLSLKVLGIFCVLDAELAKEHFMMFCFNIANETLSVTALECVFDMLFIYGLANFNIEDPDQASVTNAGTEDEGPPKPNLVVLLMSLLNSESQQMRKTSVIGLCKLLFAGRIKSADLVSKLIILWYSPIVENDAHIRQPLGVFFRMFTTSCPHAPHLLLKAFVPTIKELFKMEVADPLSEVEVESVANLMVEFTRPGLNTHTPKELHVHNQIAIQLCEEVLSEELESANCVMLVKVLSRLELNYSLTDDINTLSDLLARMIKNLPREDKHLVRLIIKFDTTVKVRQENNRSMSTVNNTLPADQTSRSQFLLSGRSTSGSDSEAEDDMGLSQNSTPDHGHTADADDIIVPGTPESSDSDLESLFKGFCPFPEKMPRLSQESDTDFKLPSIPSKSSKMPGKTPKRTASKTPSKAATFSPKKSRTPRKVSALSPRKSRTPANARVGSPSKLRKQAGKSRVESPSKTTSPKKTRTTSPIKSPTKTRKSSPTKGKTPAKVLVSSPSTSRSARSRVSSPKSSSSSRSSSVSSPASSPLKGRRATRTPAGTPVQSWQLTSLSPDNGAAPARVTRSTKKRK